MLLVRAWMSNSHDKVRKRPMPKVPNQYWSEHLFLSNVEQANAIRGDA